MVPKEIRVEWWLCYLRVMVPKEIRVEWWLCYLIVMVPKEIRVEWWLCYLTVMVPKDIRVEWWLCLPNSDGSKEIRVEWWLCYLTIPHQKSWPLQWMDHSQVWDWQSCRSILNVWHAKDAVLTSVATLNAWCTHCTVLSSAVVLPIDLETSPQRLYGDSGDG